MTAVFEIIETELATNEINKKLQLGAKIISITPIEFPLSSGQKAPAAAVLYVPAYYPIKN